jgi:hypothetical protein
MGFSFEVAPGIRVRANSHGVHTSIGSRPAWVTAEAGGPVTLYRFTGGGRRPWSANPAQALAAHYERPAGPVQMARQAADLEAAFDAIENLHRQEIIAAVPPVAPAPAPVDGAVIHRWHEEQALRGLSARQRAARTTARQQAAEMARRDINAASTRSFHEQAQLQAWLDSQWRGLLANDPAIVFATLTEAFEANHVQAAVTGTENGEASVVVIAPDIDAVPGYVPQQTPAGDVSLAKITMTSRNSYYLKLVCGHVLLTVREAFTVAPRLQAVRVAVLRQAPPGAYGIRKTECLLAAVFTRPRMSGVSWRSATSVQLVQDTSTDLRARLSGSGEQVPLDLAQEPALAALLQVVDTGEDGAPADTGVLGGNRLGRAAHSPLPAAAAPAPRPPVAPALLAAPGPALTANLLAPGPLRTRRQTRLARAKVRYATLVTLGAVVLLVIIALGSSHGTTTTPANDASAVAVITATPTASPSPAPRASKQKEAQPKTTASPARAVTTPQAVITAAAPSSTASAGCSPKSAAGNCYQPGEFCSKAEHEQSGVAGDGKAIVCESNDGWRWEPA